MTIKPFLPMCLALAVATSAWAKDEIDYTYAEAGYFMTNDASDGDVEVDGVQIRLLGQIHDYVHLRGEYVRGDADFSGLGNTDADRYLLGAGGHYNFSDTISGFFDLAYASLSFNSSPSDGIPKSDDEGMLAEGGVRAMVTDKIELDGSVAYWDFGDDDDVYIGLGGFYDIGANFMVGASTRIYTDSENGEEYFIGARYNF